MIGVTNIPDVAKFAISAPANTSVTISYNGSQVVTGSTGSSTLCVLTVRKLGVYSIAATFDGTTITQAVGVARLGKKYPILFPFTASLIVATYPGATVTASKTGQTTLTGTATSAGYCELIIPAGGRGTWTLSASYSSFSETGSVEITHYNDSFSAEVHLAVPIFTFTPTGGTAVSIDESTVSGSSSTYYYYRNGTDWEFYALTSGTLTLPNKTSVNIFLCGAGAAGGAGSADGTSWYDQYGTQQTLYHCTSCDGGSGGVGGGRKTLTEVINGTQTVTCGASNGAASLLGSYTSSGGTYSAQNANGGYSFDDSTAKGPDGNSRLVGAGGGNGACSVRDHSDFSGSYSAGSGGTYGGGAGGAADASGDSGYARTGSSGTYWGAGGGGGGAWGNLADTNVSHLWGSANGGAGYKGFVAIRNKRAA